ncbi:MAG: response regulator [Armatimonadetes bacterium]|nr:response regulator [Armatimonadota bacterium]
MTIRKSKKKVLLIDDDQAILTSISSYLELEGYEVLSALGGKEGLQKSQEPGVDVIVLDIMMPEMDGYQVVRELRRAPETSRIPVIFLTAKDTDGEVMTGWQRGAVAYITKPFDFPVLLREIEKC